MQQSPNPLTIFYQSKGIDLSDTEAKIEALRQHLGTISIDLVDPEQVLAALELHYLMHELPEATEGN